MALSIRNQLFIVSFCWVPMLAFAGPGRFSPEAEVSVALVHENVIVLQETDLLLRAGDSAINSEVTVGFDAQLQERFDLAARYTHNETRYQRAGGFDLSTQLLNVSTGYSWEIFHIGFDVFAAAANLNQQSYLSLLQAGPSIRFAIGERVFLQSSVGYRERQLAQREEENTFGSQASLRLYYLIARTDHYVFVSHTNRKEESETGGLGSTADLWSLGWMKKNEWWGKAVDTSFKISYELQYYAMRQPTRKDRLGDFQADIKMNLSDHLYVDFSYQYIANTSSSMEFDYQQHRTELRVGVHL